jgi:hypothetical protein
VHGIPEGRDEKSRRVPWKEEGMAQWRDTVSITFEKDVELHFFLRMWMTLGRDVDGTEEGSGKTVVRERGEMAFRSEVAARGGI